MKKACLILLIFITGASLFGCKATEKTPEGTPISVEKNESSSKTDDAVGNQTKVNEQEVEIPGVIGKKDEISEAASAEVQKYVKEDYQKRRKFLVEDLGKKGVSESDPLVVQGKKNLDELEKLAYKAYTNCANSFYCEELVKNGDRPEKLRKLYFDIKLGTRVEEIVNGKLSTVTVLDLKSDISYTYNAEKDRLEKVINAASKGEGMSLFDIDSFDINRNNARSPKSTFEKVDYNGISAVKFSYTEKMPKEGTDFYNAVWFDAETGLLLQELQEHSAGKFGSTFDTKTNVEFDPAVFTFDQKKPTVKDMMAK